MSDASIPAADVETTAATIVVAVPPPFDDYSEDSVEVYRDTEHIHETDPGALQDEA